MIAITGIANRHLRSVESPSAPAIPVGDDRLTIGDRIGCADGFVPAKARRVSARRGAGGHACRDLARRPSGWEEHARRGGRSPTRDPDGADPRRCDGSQRRAGRPRRIRRRTRPTRCPGRGPSSARRHLCGQGGGRRGQATRTVPADRLGEYLHGPEDPRGADRPDRGSPPLAAVAVGDRALDE